MTVPRTSEPTVALVSRPTVAGRFVSGSWRFVAVFVLVLLAMPTGLVAIFEGTGHIPLPFNLYVVDAALPVVFRLHMLSAGLVLVLIPVVLAMRRDRRWHRALGRLAAAGVVVGAITSFPVAVESTSPDLARAGFAAQGIAWLLLLFLGLKSARRRAMNEHATFMLAMAAVASGAIWTRLTTALIADWDLPFDPIYAVTAWAGWLLPLALVLHARPRLS